MTSKKVLLVDDEPVLRRSLTRIIGRLGYEVIEAADADEALALTAEDVALAIVDVKLPGMSGVECVRHLQARHPRVQAVLMTGGRVPRVEGIRVLDKPFGRTELQTLLAELIDRKRH